MDRWPALGRPIPAESPPQVLMVSLPSVSILTPE